jgi:hypothetical protein
MLPAWGAATMNKVGLWLVMGSSVLGCSKSEPPAGATATASAPGVPATEAAAEASSSSGLQSSSAPEASSAAAPSAAAPAAATTPATGAPTSFKGGSKETIGAAVGLGCEATSLDGWLQLLCRKKNGTGGHPVRAVVHDPNAPAQEPSGQEPSGAPAEGPPRGDELTANEQGELAIVVPFSGDEKRDVVIEWTDTSYTLHVAGAQATLEWAAAGVAHRRACQQLLDENKALIAAAQKAEGESRLTTTEASKLPRFGTCREGGLGSWALSLRAVSGKGEGAARLHHFELDVVRVDVDGGRKATSFGSVDVAPGGFELASLQVYDYDDDGRDELIVPYELKAMGGATPSYPPPVWSWNDSGVAAYAKAPQVGGGIGVEQLDFDMRPDFSSYGPFVAFFGQDCGLKSCPPRVTGPKLYLHATPEGSFSDHDDAAKSALKRAMCQSKPAAVVVEAAGALNAAQTAKNLVCAKAYGVSEEAIVSELGAKQAALCGEAASCPLKTTLETWAKLALPVALASGAAPDVAKK